MRKTYIYGIKDLELHKFIYVGKSNAPHGRFKGHMQYPSNDCVRKLVEEKGKDNFCLEVLETVEATVSEDWVEREKFWIKKFKEEEHPLCNKNDGGGGIIEQTDATLAKMSEAQSGENNPMYGRHRTEEVKMKLREANLDNEYSSKPYPAFFNIFSGETIPTGKNLMKMCKHHNLSHGAIYGVKSADNKQTGDGWRLASYSDKPLEYEYGKSYPTFLNVLTGEVIPAGKNLMKICEMHNLSYDVMWHLGNRDTKQTRDGWRLAKEGEGSDGNLTMVPSKS